MFKLLTALLLFPGFIFSAVLTRTYNFDTPLIISGKVTVDGGRPARSLYGPNVPVRAANLLLPRGHKVKSIRFDYGTPTMMAGEHYVMPHEPAFIASPEVPRLPLAKTSATYAQDEYFPGHASAAASVTQYKNGHAIATATMRPVQYNPVTEKVRYFSKVSVTVETEADSAAPIRYKVTPAIISKLKLYVDNPEQLEGLELTPRAPGDYEYLIVCENGFEGAFGEFVLFNERRGLRTKIMTMNQVLSENEGRDEAEKLRNAIIKEYNGHSIQYVLLAGDDDHDDLTDIPHRGLRSYMYDHHVGADQYYDERDIPADLYYSCLDGDWKTHRDTRKEMFYYGDFGTEDLGWEVYTARMPVDNVTELTNALNKTMKYSEQPVADEIKNHTMVGEYLWDHGEKMWGIQNTRLLRSVHDDHGFTTVGFPETWKYNELAEMESGWSFGMLLNSMQDNKTTWMDHNGHASNEKFIKLNTSDITDSTFTFFDGVQANYFMLTTGIACYSGAFDNRNKNMVYKGDCWSEMVLRQPNGPVATLSNSRYGWGDNDGTNSVSVRTQRWFHDAIFGKGIHNLEEMNAYAKMVDRDAILNPDIINNPPYYGNQKWVVYEYNIFGDPALSLWTENVGSLSPDIQFSGTEVQVSGHGKYAQVAFVNPAGEIISSIQTGDEAVSRFDVPLVETYLSANPGSKMKIRIKAHNFLPYEGSLPVADVIVGTKRKMHHISYLPLSGVLNISYTLPIPGRVQATIHNAQGVLVHSLLKAPGTAGTHTHTFDTGNLKPGGYYCSLRFGDKQLANKFFVSH